MTAVDSSTWRTVGASIRGSGHEKTGLPCQDAHGFAVQEGWLLVAVSDGAGSAPMSDQGARFAVEESLVRLAGLDPEGDLEPALREIVASVRAGLTDYAAHLGQEAKALACTLILLVASTDRVAVVSVGDGGAVVVDGSGSSHALLRPVRGEYINETTFLCSPGALESIEAVDWKGEASLIAVHTDGIQSVSMNLATGEPFAPFFGALDRFMAAAPAPEAAQKELEGLLGGEKMRARTDDDVTLVLAAPQPGSQS